VESAEAGEDRRRESSFQHEKLLGRERSLLTRAHRVRQRGAEAQIDSISLPRARQAHSSRMVGMH
jgi:hypothetical protein